MAIIPVSWNAEWPPHGLEAAVARSLYFVILAGYWVVLVRAAPSSGPSSGSTAEPDAGVDASRSAPVAGA